MLDKGPISRKSNRVIAESDPLPGSPPVYRKDLPPGLKLMIQGTILSAHKDIKVTGYGKISHYVAANAGDYQIVRDMVKVLGLKKDQLM